MSPLFGAIATPHHLATEAGEHAYRSGGNAIDAALAAAAALAVVYPHNTAIGGDLVALVRTPDGETVCVNATGSAVAATRLKELRRRYGNRLPDRAPATITVPGAVRGWHTIRGYGAALDWPSQFGAAIRYAAGGVPVAPSLASAFATDGEVLLSDPGARSVFAPSGDLLQAGGRLIQPQLAATLERIAANGPDELYGGEVGTALATGLQSLGAPMTIADLAAYRSRVTTPISAPLNGFQVSTSPPNTQGFALLRTLRALSALGLDTLPPSVPADVLGRLFADGARVRDTLLADPEFARTDVENDGFDELIADLAGRGPRVTEFADEPSVPGGDTVGVAAADSHGYAVSLIQSLYDNFGSGRLEPSTGILMQNRGRSFSLDPSSANVIAPGKRPVHTLMPVIVTVGPHVRWVNAAMGGQAQPQIHGQVLLQLLAGRSAQQAVSTPRWVVGPRTPGDRSDTVYHESDVPRDAVDALDADGFPLRAVPAHTQFLGHVNVISIDSDGIFTGGSDPRSDGSVAIVELGVV